MIPRYGTPPETGRRYRRRAGAYAVLWRDGEVLLTHQDQPWPEFQLPGGGIDPGESPVQALHREVYEETGWHIGPARRLGTFRRFTYMPEYDLWAEKLCMIYLARPVRRISAPTEPGHDAVWMAPDTAVQVLGNDGDASFLAGVIRWLR
ncbi:MAG: NUDIX hydrolase [Rhodobacter sp.]|nr:NUDIX hydrolase [Paracoccaceae bacterium]MCC0077640.1 NUDIX hydrolase [Rhodobacter sp.]